MNKKVLLWAGLAGLVVLAAAAAGVYNWVLGPTLAASGAITAIPIVVSVNTFTPQSAAATQAEPVAETTAEPAAADTAAAPTSEPATDSQGGLLVLTIDQAQSEVRFILTEELRGQPKTVVGASNQVAGQIAVDPSDLSTAQVGIIQVNARTLATDSSQRDRAIRNQILSTDAYEYINFTPSQVLGLSGSAAAGDAFTFQIAGTLTIRDISQEVVFDVTATVEAANQLSGTATTTVQRADYDLTIPNVPSVANVSQSVTVEIDFVATGVQNDGNG
jgi:polyisoprenoid-binding protein YceI